MARRDELSGPGIILGYAMLVGGAGNAYPWLEAALEGAALLLVGATLWRSPGSIGSGRAFLMFWGCCLVWPLLQLIPLPADMWRALPGRALAAQVTDLTGTATQWRPFSLDPERTLGAALAQLAPGAMLLAVLRMSERRRGRLVLVVLAGGALSLALGVAQVAAGNDSLRLSYETLHRDSPVGLFVNRNHQATFLLVAMVLSGAVGARAFAGAGPRRLLALVYPAIMALGVVATASRTGTVLLAFAVPMTLFLVFHDRLDRRTIGAAALVLIVASLALSGSDAGRQTLARFSARDDARSMFWADTTAATDRYFPAGSGTGTFRTVQPIDEPLAFVSPRIPNNAHNDYLELLMDSGAAAIAGFAFFALLYAGAIVRTLRRPRGDERLMSVAALSGIAIVLLCSVTDYPLRMTALTTLFGLLAGLSVPAPRAIAERPQPPLPIPLARRTAVAAVLVAIGVLCVLYAASIDVTRRAAFRTLSSRLPWAAAVPAANATDDLLAGRTRDALTTADLVLRRAPLNVSALRTTALAAEQLGDPSVGRRIMPVAGRLGWRDRFTQYWLMEHGFRDGDVGAALMRTDALLRQDVLTDELFAMLHRAMAEPAVRAALADRLATEPRWSDAWLADVASLNSAAQLDHGALLLALRRRDAALADTYVGTLADAMVARGQGATANRFWRALGRSAMVNDGGFDLLALPVPRSRGPFEWSVSSASNVYVTAEPPPAGAHGPALHVRGEGAIIDPIVSQFVAIPPGRFVLHYRTASVLGDGADPAIEWQLRCADGTDLLGRAQRGNDARAGWRRFAVSFDIPPAGCALQQLQLRSSSSEAVEAWLDDVTPS